MSKMFSPKDDELSLEGNIKQLLDIKRKAETLFSMHPQAVERFEYILKSLQYLIDVAYGKPTVPLDKQGSAKDQPNKLRNNFQTTINTIKQSGTENDSSSDQKSVKNHNRRR